MHRSQEISIHLPQLLLTLPSLWSSTVESCFSNTNVRLMVLIFSCASKSFPSLVFFKRIPVHNFISIFCWQYCELRIWPIPIFQIDFLLKDAVLIVNCTSPVFLIICHSLNLSTHYTQYPVQYFNIYITKAYFGFRIVELCYNHKNEIRM